MVERWRLDYNRGRPHSARDGLTPEAVRERRLRNPDQLRQAPATIEAPQPLETISTLIAAAAPRGAGQNPMRAPG